MMKTVKMEPLTFADQISVGTALVINDGEQLITTQAKKVKDCLGDVEVIIDVAKNKFFSVRTYLAGKSWAKEVFIVSTGE